MERRNAWLVVNIPIWYSERHEREYRETQRAREERREEKRRWCQNWDINMLSWRWDEMYVCPPGFRSRNYLPPLLSKTGILEIKPLCSLLVFTARNFSFFAIWDCLSFYTFVCVFPPYISCLFLSHTLFFLYFFLYFFLFFSLSFSLSNFLLYLSCAWETDTSAAKEEGLNQYRSHLKAWPIIAQHQMSRSELIDRYIELESRYHALSVKQWSFCKGLGVLSLWEPFSKGVFWGVTCRSSHLMLPFFDLQLTTGIHL